MSENGLKIIQDLDQLTIDHVLTFSFSPANIFLNFTNGKSSLIVRCGDFVEPDKLAKYKNQNSRLFVEKIVNTDAVDKISQALIKFEKSKLESEKIKNRDDFIHVLQVLITKDQFSTFDLSMAFFNVFNQIKVEDLRELNSYSVIFLRRSFLLSATYACLSIFQGVNDYNLLSDMYHMSFLQDIALVYKFSTYNIEKIYDCISENLEKREADLDKTEMDLYIASAIDSKKIISEKFKNVFNSIEFCEIIDRHLESVFAQLGPKGLRPNELSDYESLLLEVNTLIGLKNIDFRKNDFLFLVNKLKERKEISRSRGFRIMYKEFEKIIKEEVEVA